MRVGDCAAADVATAMTARRAAASFLTNMIPSDFTRGRHAKTVRNMRWFEVTGMRGHIEDGKVAHYQVTLKVGFTLED